MLGYGPFRYWLELSMPDAVPAVRDGGAVLMFRVRGDRRTRAALGALREHGGHFINYYGRFATEELERWRGPEPDIPDLMRR